MIVENLQVGWNNNNGKVMGMKSFFLGGGIGICLISAYLMVKGYVEYGTVALIIGVVAIGVSSRKKDKVD